MRPLITAEILKLLRQPALLFFGFLSVAALSILFKFGLEGFVYLRTGRAAAGEIDMLASAGSSLGISGNSMGHLLYAIGIGSVFFLEYRYATWRLIVPRHSRVELYLAKIIVCLGFLAAGLLLAAVGDLVLNVMRAMVNGNGLGGLALPLPSALTLLGAFAIALLELAVLSAFVAVVVIVSRSMITAVVAAFALAIGSSILGIYLGRDAERLPLPSYAAQAARDWLLSGADAMAGATGLAVLGLWFVALLGFGLLVFSRQQLAAE